MNNRIECLNTIQKIRSEAIGNLLSLEQGLSRISLKDVKQTVIIHSPPRSGSSLLYKLLSSQDDVFYSLNGEAVPFYKLNGLNQDHPMFCDDSIRDACLHLCCDVSNISQDMVCDLFLKNTQIDFGDRKAQEQYFTCLIMRLLLQWPKIDFDFGMLFQKVEQAFTHYQAKYASFTTSLFYVELFKVLREEYPEINPFYYDIDPHTLKRAFPEISVPLGPPNNDFMLEEPPFIVVHPFRHVTADDLANKILLLKTSIDVYRINLIKKLIPNAEIKILYLMRNPAGTINGLYDGWLHHGFFSYNLKRIFENGNNGHHGKTHLKISGYSDKYEFGKFWWNFDLPPGWINYIEQSLEEVCVFQWLSSASRIVAMMERSEYEFCLIRYENIIRDYETRLNEFHKIFAFLGKGSLNEALLKNLPIVQATKRPKKYRWKKREYIIKPIMTTDVFDVANKLGYTKDREQEWL